MSGDQLVIIHPGPLTLLEDLGRPGYAHLGVTGSGAFDRRALRLANRLVGNPEPCAGLEALAGGLTVTFTSPAVIAVTGAHGAVTVAGRVVERWAPIRVAAGDELALGGAVGGLRSYLAVRGGLLGTPVLGSLAADPTTGLGPAPLVAGAQLPIGAPPPAAPARCGIELAPSAARAGEIVVRAVWGPRADWLTPTARATFGHARWQVNSASDRVGVRLDGPVLARAVTGELRSEGVVRGSVQVPPSGRPVVFGPDHPTTGGYPVAAVVLDADIDLLAQLAPGAGVRFRVRDARW